MRKKIQDGFNKQINEELFSSYLYLSMSAHFESQNLKGMASWFRHQAGEEVEHAMKFLDFIHVRGGSVQLNQVAKPKAKWASPMAAFEDAYKHECKISKLIDKLVDLAVSEKDHAANAFLQWFVTEQVEEEDSTLGVVERLKLAGNNIGAILLIDKELGDRSAASGG